MDEQGQQSGWRPHRRQLAISGGLLLFGMCGLIVLGAIRRAPSEVAPAEKALRVDGVRLEAIDFPVALTGYGAVRPLRMVGIAAEVPGILVHIHPSLRAGQTIPEGEVLFAIDDQDYQAAVLEAEALAEQGRMSILRMDEELRRNRNRLETVKRNFALAQGEFDRTRDLYEQHQIGSQADLDLSERPLNTARDAVDQLEKSLAIAPLLISEAKTSQEAAESRLERARRQLERCTVRAPFEARVVRAKLEKGQLVHAAAEMVILADDSVLEIAVPLDVREAHKWLQFQPGAGSELAWFPDVKPVPCTVRWTEAPDSHQWTGVLHRVEQMSVETRTLKVVIRIQGRDASNAHGFPLVEGMFCSVEIPGRTLTGVFRAPRWAVSVDQTVYLSVDSRLSTRPVRVAYTHQDEVFIDDGLEPGELLVVTRLSDPLENILLDLNRIDVEAAIP